MMILLPARALANRAAPAALLILIRRPAIPLSGVAFVRQGKLLSAAERESLELLPGWKPLNPPARK